MADEERGLGPFEYVPVEVAVAIGSCTMPLREVLQLGPGAVVMLDRAVGAPVDVLVNDELIARGALIAVDDRYAVRIEHVVERPR
jgi:flagellar motor switch protein FliN